MATENITDFLTRSKLEPDDDGPTPMLEAGPKVKDPKTTTFSDSDRVLSGMASLILNLQKIDEAAIPAERERRETEAEKAGQPLIDLPVLMAERVNPETQLKEVRFQPGLIDQVISEIDKLIDLQLNRVLHSPRFVEMETAWRSVEDLVNHVNFGANITVDLLDVTKDELQEDFESNAIDISKSALFSKIYTDEYDQYGGRPFGTMIGLYEFKNSTDDLDWLQRMGKIANAAHCPFIAAAEPKFFGADKASDLADTKDLAGLLNHPKYSRWNSLRDTEEAAYIGLTFPRYILRMPYNPETNPARGLNFTESVGPEHRASLPADRLPEEAADRNDDGYLWGNAAVLVARNMARSFETSGWCQYLRGPKGGGLIDDLPVHTFVEGGEEVIKMPVEIAIPDHRELEFANGGFIPFVYRKDSGVGAFFSVQSAKKSHRFKDPKDSENSQLVTNLAYTLSITRIAHYVKSIMRDNIGTTADEAYIQRILETWMLEKVTTVVNPDELTLRYYPFKAAEVTVAKRDGQIGHYDCTISVLPHIQFEGLDVELRLEARLG